MARVTKPVEERRQEIIDTARSMFLENGYDKTQVADISKKMDVAAGTVYHYFKSKTEILYAVIDELADEKMQKKLQILKESKGSSRALLEMTFVSFENDEIHSGFRDGFADDPAIFQYLLTKLVNSYTPILISLIEKGNTDGSWNCEYPRETAFFLLQGIAAVLTQEQARNDSPEEKDERFKAYRTIVFQALGAVSLP